MTKGPRIQRDTAQAQQRRPSTSMLRNGMLLLLCSFAACMAVTAHALTFPPTVTKSFSPNHVSVGSTTQMTITLSNSNIITLTGAALTDTYPVGMAKASTGVVVSNTCGGTLTADPDGVSAALANGSIPPAGCAIVLNVTGRSDGAGLLLTNHTGPVTTNQTFASNDATADLTIDPFSVGMAFSPSYVSVGGTTQMTITLRNHAAAPITGVTFADSYPVGMANAQSGVVVSNTCGGALTAAPNGLSVSLVGGVIPPGNFQSPSSCKIELNVTATPAGAGQALTNHTGSVTTDQTFTFADATAGLSVSGIPLLQAPIVTMTALPDSIGVGGTAAMLIVLTNPNVQPIVGARFAINYPAPVHIVNSTLAGDVLLDENLCIVGSDTTGHAGDAFVSVMGATIPAGDSCAFFLYVMGQTAGDSELHTGPVLSANANAGADAVATLTVAGGSLLAAPTLQKAFSPTGVRVGGTAQMMITLVNSDADNAITGVQLEDLYPPGIANAPDALVRNTCDGLILLHPHDGNTDDLHLFNGTIPAGGACNVVVNVVGTIGGASPFNQISNVLSGNAEVGGLANATVAVTGGPLLGAPNASLAFAPPTVAVGESSQMTITLNNANAFAITGAQFNDLYPDGIANAPSGPVVASNTCGGTMTADAGGDFVALTNGTVPPAGAGGTCSIVVNVIGKSAGQWTDQTGPIPAANALTGAAAFSGLTVQGGATVAAPSVGKAFDPASISVGEASQMTITLTNNDPSRAVIGMEFTDLYPGGMANAPSGVVDTNATTCNGIVTAPQNGLSASFVNGTLPANGTCKVVINVVGTAQGVSLNETGPVTSTNADPGASASATLTVNGPLMGAPGVSTSFVPDHVRVGGVSQMTITLDNANSSKITGVQLTDDFSMLPMRIIDIPDHIVVSNTCGGTLALVPNGTSAGLAGGEIPANGSCSLVVNITGTAVGSAENHTGIVQSDNAIDGPDASATLFIDSGPLLAAPTVTKSFSPDHATEGGTVQMTITLANPNPTDEITGAQFLDSYPVEIVNAPADMIVSNTCLGTLTAEADTVMAALADGTIPAGGSCEVVVNVVVTGAPGATILNHSGLVLSADANQGAEAIGALTVDNGSLLVAPSVSKSFAPDHVLSGGASQMTITLTNANGISIMGAQVTDIYPSGIANAPVNPVLSDTCNFSENVPPGGTWAKLSNGTIPASSCSIVIAVVGTVTATNDTGTAYAANALPAAGASATLTVQGSGVTPQTIAFTSTAPAGAMVGGATYSAAAIASSGLPVVLTIDGASATVCTISAGTVSFIGAGTCTIDANQGGDATFAPAPQMQQSFAVAGSGGATPQTIAFTSTPPNNATVAGPAYGAAAAATSGLPVVLTIDASSATVCTINAGAVSFIGAGTCTIDANQGGGMNGGTNYAPAPQMQQSFAVASSGGATPQTIAFTSNPPGNATVGGPTYQAMATATSGLPVVLTIDGASATVCAINAGTVSFIGAGTCTIDANQGGGVSGGTKYAPAAQMQQSFAVAGAGGQQPQTISFTSVAPANATVGGPTYFATATATSNLPVVLTIDSASATVCTINTGIVAFIGAGTCTIDANQGGGMNGGTNYAPAPQVQQSFVVAGGGGQQPQTITFTSTAPASAFVGGPTYLATATATSGLPVVLTIDATSASVCTINAGTVTFIGAGSCTIDANQGGGLSGGTDYAPAAQVQQSFAVTNGGGSGNHAPIGVGEAVEVAPNGTASDLVGDAEAVDSLLDNDLDVDGDPLTAVKVSDPANGTLLQFQPDGTFVYQASIGSGTDTFTYQACDPFACSMPTAVTITIGNGLNNHVPFATDDAIAVATGGATGNLIGDLAATDSVLDNDIDPDVEALTALKLSDPLHGTLSLAPDGTFSYQNDGTGTTDGAWYEACDSHGACSLGALTMTIGAAGFADHVPVVVDDALQVVPGQSATTLIGDMNMPNSVLDNDSDPDGDTLTATKASSLLNDSGILSLQSDGTLTYQNIDVNATFDSVLYEACDPFGACRSGIVMITITNNPLDHLPTAVDDAIVVGPHGTATALIGGASSVLANDTDQDPGETATLKAHLISAPANGHITLNTDGTFVYVNDDSAPGIDSWQYEACDTEGACVPATVSVTIDSSVPTVTCLLPRQLEVVGDTVSLDLSLLFAPPAGQTLGYSATNLPPSLSIMGSLLTGTLQASDVPPSPPYTYASTLIATTNIQGGASVSEDVTFQVLPTGEILLRDGFDGGVSLTPPCQ